MVSSKPSKSKIFNNSKSTNITSNSIIAVDLVDKKIIWSFQETSHDIWNSDLPAPPILTNLNYTSLNSFATIVVFYLTIVRI